MARTKRNTKVDTRTARAKLAPRREPYWTVVSEGCAVGYRKGKTGSWVARWRDPDGRQHYTSLGAADDSMDADAVTILTAGQAQEQARGWFADQVRAHVAGIGSTGPYTVADALDDYMQWFRAHRKSVRDTERAINAHIRPALGAVEVKDLTTKQVRDWHAALAAAPARVRSAPGEEQAYRSSSDARARKSTANRVLTVLKAALNHAWSEGKVASDDAWRRVRPYREADAVRLRYLSRDEWRRLVNACEPDLRRLVTGALLTGARYGELAAMTVGDWTPDAGTVLVYEAKSGKPRHVVLTDEGRACFDSVTAGRPSSERIFTKADGAAWGRSHQTRPLRLACERARIDPPASFHTLRHTYASHMVMAGVPLPVVSNNLGHADTRMTEKHYAHLAPSYLADAIRGRGARFDLAPDEAVVPLRARNG